MPKGSDLRKDLRASDAISHPIRFDEYENLTMNISQWYRDDPYLSLPLTPDAIDPRIIPFHLTHDQLIKRSADDPYNGNFEVANVPEKLYFYVNGNKAGTAYKEILISGVIIVNGIRTPF